MTIRNLDHLFRPKSVALLGASDRPSSVGAVLARNLRAGGFAGRVMLVAPKHAAIDGEPCYPDVASLPETPDLAVVATPPDTVPGLVAALAARGTKAAVVVTAGFGEGAAARGRALRQAMLDAARPHLLRVVGPNCLGVMAPGRGLNATFAHLGARPGTLALVSQSGAVLAGVLDWASARDVGFSHLVSVGDMADVDLGDLLDHLALDPATSAVLLYVEAVTHARKFMSAARAAARLKPVIVLKAGRHEEGARAAASHTGALAGADAVHEAAFRRAGMLRVRTLRDLFDAAEILARSAPVAGDRLAVVTNGGGYLRMLAGRYRDEAAVAAYDLVNEPYRFPIDQNSVLRAYDQLIGQVREVDPDKIVLIEPTYGDTSVAGALADFSNLKRRTNVVYSLHDYFAGGDDDGYTADGRQKGNYAWDGVTGYPAPDPGALEAHLRVHVDKLRAAGIPLWIGEFGIGAEVAGHDRWIADKVALFKRYGLGRAWWEYRTTDPFSATLPDGAWQPWIDLLGA